MMVPRGFLHTAPTSPRASRLDEKDVARTTQKPPKPQKGPWTPLAPKSNLSESLQSVSSDPVTIPNRRGSRSTLAPVLSLPEPTRSMGNMMPPLEMVRGQSFAGEPVQTLLAATAIPLRKKPRGRKLQRLPGGDYVAEFSRLLLEDVHQREDGLVVGSQGNPQFEALFGHFPEVVESPIIDGNDGVAESLLSMRSASTDSVPSLADDSATTSCNEATSLSPPATRKPNLERKPRALSSSEDCAQDHPLLYTDTFTPLSSSPPEPTEVPTPNAASRPRSEPRAKGRTSSFRSNLTASLRALKSAAQTVSNLASTPPILTPDDFLTRSIFSFAPELTDDKRPPPSDNPPSAAMRRYLNPSNPPHESTAEFHRWHEPPASRPTKSKKKNKAAKKQASPPPAIQLQTCIPSAIRSPTASSPPIWLSADGVPISNMPELASFAAPNLARQREPRENRDFLRILVAEMNMRRSGKFGDDIESHAYVWLPARKLADKPALTGSRRWEVLPSDPGDE